MSRQEVLGEDYNDIVAQLNDDFYDESLFK